MIMLYIALRFQFKFAVGAVISLAHDVLLTLAFFSITGLTFDLTVLAAVLAVIGYSLNDTIVVADRIRENFRILRGTEPHEVIDIAVTQTLIRTTITSLTTLLVLCSLFFFGGQVVEGFSIALIFGVVVGTYSSIYVASSALMFLHITKEDLMPAVRDKDELDALP
jgi:preprotein translocase subunit SecF